MEEQPPKEGMGETPGQSQDGVGDKPAIFKNLNGWIGGITGVVIALAGLRAAYQQLMPDPPVQAAAAEQAGAATDEAAEAAPVAEADEEMPLLYETDYNGILEYTGGRWVYTPEEGDPVSYEQLSRDEITTIAIDRKRDAFLRWPTYGGSMAQESEDDQAHWTDVYNVYVPEEPAADEAAEPAAE